MRNKFTIASPPSHCREALLTLCSGYEHAIFLDSNNRNDAYSRFEYRCAFGCLQQLAATENSLARLGEALQRQPDWYFGHLTFDLKNQLEDLHSRHRDRFDFAPLEFFRPKTIATYREGKLEVESSEYEHADDFLRALPTPSLQTPVHQQVVLSATTSRDQYLQNVAALKEHLQFGNIYEVNYCIELAGENISIDPAATFKRLNDSARAPFAAFYRRGHNFLICASPERYLQKKGDRLISQPIKCTAPRGKSAEEDEQLKNDLLASEKERSENIMITDLVRNDLSRTAAAGSVKVEELFGLYTFNAVHQMITTISSQLAKGKGIAEVLATSFPMGSMTGAPKVKAMELIDQHENFARSLYSGAVGYISPESDFDFNVVIRSLLYNSRSKYLSARVGSAITIHCDAEKEYEECLLKADNLLQILRD